MGFHLNGIFLRYIKMNSNLQLKLPVIPNSKPAETAKPPVGINLMLPIQAAAAKPPVSVNLNLMLPVSNANVEPTAEKELLNNSNQAPKANGAKIIEYVNKSSNEVRGSTSDFSNNKRYWKNTEIEELNKLYNVENLDVIQISNILGRTPYAICCQLIKKNYIKNKYSARGYREYLNSRPYDVNDFESKTNELVDSQTTPEDNSNVNKESPVEKETVKSHWNSFEDNYLNKHYNIDNYDVEKIADLHNRSVSSIIDRLVKLKYISDKKFARGYENTNELASLKSEFQILKEELNKLKSMLESST